MPLHYNPKTFEEKKIVKVNIKLSKLRQRPQESGYAESAFLIFGSLSTAAAGKTSLIPSRSICQMLVDPHEYAMRFTFPHC